MKRPRPRLMHSRKSRRKRKSKQAARSRRPSAKPKKKLKGVLGSSTAAEASSSSAASSKPILSPAQRLERRKLKKKKRLAAEAAAAAQRKARKAEAAEDEAAAAAAHARSAEEAEAPPEEFLNVPFSSLDLLDGTKAAIAAMGFETLTEIQARAIPPLMRGQDVLAQAKTWEWKTLAFLVPSVELLARAKWLPRNGTGMIAISPTRELALQIYGVLARAVRAAPPDARPRHRRRQPARRGRQARKGRLSPRRDAGAAARPPDVHEGLCLLTSCRCWRSTRPTASSRSASRRT